MVENKRIEWTGNPFKDGLRMSIGDLSAELLRVSPAEIGMSGGTAAASWRGWRLIIVNNYRMRFGLGDCLVSVVLINLVTEQAKREAEKILKWAAASEGTDTRKE